MATGGEGIAQEAAPADQSAVDTDGDRRQKLIFRVGAVSIVLALVLMMFLSALFSDPVEVRSSLLERVVTDAHRTCAEDFEPGHGDFQTCLNRIIERELPRIP